MKKEEFFMISIFLIIGGLIFFIPAKYLNLAFAQDKNAPYGKELEFEECGWWTLECPEGTFCNIDESTPLPPYVCVECIPGSFYYDCGICKKCENGKCVNVPKGEIKKPFECGIGGRCDGEGNCIHYCESDYNCPLCYKCENEKCIPQSEEEITCPITERCNDGNCEYCNSDFQCGECYKCINGKCQPIEAGEPGKCFPGYYCNENHECEKGCQFSTDCPPCQMCRKNQCVNRENTAGDSRCFNCKGGICVDGKCVSCYISDSADPIALLDLDTKKYVLFVEKTGPGCTKENYRIVRRDDICVDLTHVREVSCGKPDNEEIYKCDEGKICMNGACRNFFSVIGIMIDNVKDFFTELI